MGVISRAIPTLLRGISQSSDSTKQADHADIQDNANSDPVVGLTKRSGTQFMANLITSGTPIGNAHVKFINKNVNESKFAEFNVGLYCVNLSWLKKSVAKINSFNY